MTEEEKKAALAVGDIVEIVSDARSDPNGPSGGGFTFRGALAVIDEVKGWGVVAIIPVPWSAPGAVIPVRLAFSDFEATGGRVRSAP